MTRTGLLAGSASLMAFGALGARSARAQDARIRLLWWGAQGRNERKARVLDLHKEANSGRHRAQR